MEIIHLREKLIMTGDNVMKIKPNDVMIRYTGRIDWTDEEKPVWVYPDAHIICCTTLLCHDCSWDKAIDEVVGNMNDKMITHYVYGRNGFGTPGHLRIPEACEMATELAEYIEGLEIEGWN